jgi:putative hydrolase of the HAD superfamily
MNLNNYNTFIFDLDNTLFSSNSNFFRKVEIRMEEFITLKLMVTQKQARSIRKSYFIKYKTTLNGLLKNHSNIDPIEYYNFLSEVSLNSLKPNINLNSLLSKINSHKVIFTNSTETYAIRLIKHLKLNNILTDIMSLDKMNFISKPHISTYKILCSTYNIDPTTAIYFDDLPENLIPAAKMGMTTVLITDANSKGLSIANHNGIHHKASSLENFFTTYTL